MPLFRVLPKGVPGVCEVVGRRRGGVEDGKLCLNLGPFFSSSAPCGQRETALCFPTPSLCLFPPPHCPSSSRDSVGQRTWGWMSEMEGAVCPNFNNFTEKRIEAQGRGVYGATQLGLCGASCHRCIQFPVAALTHHHDLGGLEQQRLTLSRF